MIKDFKTIDEQLNILKDRGLIIENEEKAKNFLMKNNYYRISGYSLTLRNHDIFYENAKFQNIIDIYSFDFELRHIIFKYLENIEVNIKSVLAYRLSEKYGALGYRTNKPFTNIAEYTSIIEKVDILADKNLSFEAYLKHYKLERNEDYPFWVYIELFTISDVSRLYKITEGNIKLQVANDLGFNFSNAAQTLEVYLKCFSILRNLCAHNSRLFNRMFITKPSLNSKERKLLITDKDGNKDNSHLFSYFINIKRILPKEEFSNLKEEIVALSNKYPFVDLKYYGFNPNWYNLM